MFAKGKHAISICQRCGFQYPYSKVKREMGTNLLVCPQCDDGIYNRVTNPLNKPPRDLVDNIALERASPDEPETSVTAYDPTIYDY